MQREGKVGGWEGEKSGSQIGSTNSWHCCCWQLTFLSSPAAQSMSLSTVGHILSNWTSATFSHSKIDWKKRSCLAWERNVSCQQQQCQLLVLPIWLPDPPVAPFENFRLRCFLTQLPSSIRPLSSHRTRLCFSIQLDIWKWGGKSVVQRRRTEFQYAPFYE